MMARSVFVGCTKPVPAAAVRLKADIKPIAEVHATTAKLPRPQGSDISAAPQLFRHELFVEHRQDKIAPRLRVAVDLRPRKIEPEVFEPVPIVIDERGREGLQDGRTVVRVACCFEQDSAMLQLARNACAMREANHDGTTVHIHDLAFR